MDSGLYNGSSTSTSDALFGNAQAGTLGANQLSGDLAVDVVKALRASPLFAGLTDDEFQEVLALLHSDKANRGQHIYEIGNSNTNLYIMRRGRVVMRWHDENDVEQHRVMNPGSMFNELPFLTGVRCRNTAEALEPKTLVWYIRRDEFQALLGRRPDMKSRLVYSQEVRDVLDKVRRTDWLRPDETVIIHIKRHPLVFVRAVAVTILVAAVLLGLLLLLSQAAGLELLSLELGVLVLVPTVLIVGWEYIDWQNDYFAVTDQRVVHRERVLLIRDEQDEIPLNRIQDVTVKRAGINVFQTIVLLFLDIGTVVIDSQGAKSQVQFRDIGAPDDVTYTIFVERARALSAGHQTERAKIRTELRRELGLSLREPAKPIPRKSTRPHLFRDRFKRVTASLRNLRQTIMPRMRLVDGDKITYRKHWLLLIQTAGLQMVLFLAYVLGVIVIMASDPAIRAMLTSPISAAMFIIVGGALLFWLVWRYEDWRNDIYVVMEDRIVDIDRSPFGLRGIQQRSAPLSAVQNVTATTKGAIDLLFDMGDVTVRTGGAEGALVFERVFNPRGVQRDINARLEAYNASVRAKEAAQRSHELAEWIAIYDDLRGLHTREPDL